MSLVLRIPGPRGLLLLFLGKGRWKTTATPVEQELQIPARGSCWFPETSRTLPLHGPPVGIPGKTKRKPMAKTRVQNQGSRISRLQN